MKLNASLLAVGLTLVSGQSALERDRADFERTWPNEAQAAREAGISKELAWKLFEWSQLQFSVGYCSAYLSAESADKLRRFPDEDDLMKTERGRMLLHESAAFFKDGQDYRKEVKPSAELCRKEIDGRMRALKALANER